MDFKINRYTTISDFVRLGTYKDKIKHGKFERYEHFTGTLQGDKVKGLISTVDSNIYGLTLDE